MYEMKYWLVWKIFGFFYTISLNFGTNDTRCM